VTRTQPPPDTQSDYWDQDRPGYRVEWVETEHRRTATAEERERKCRRPGCLRAPVMALLRSNGWWLYCDWHMYGSRLTADGRVVSPRRVPEEAA
jgi:hypothetical protein